mmetsp:Transcript_14290/g.39866  ORF Transcript_14290/g.39866 Transcript_14290/m.39866 type:complete len:801 (-) Transcript_14290:148-2550(-)
MRTKFVVDSPPLFVSHILLTIVLLQLVASSISIVLRSNIRSGSPYHHNYPLQAYLGRGTRAINRSPPFSCLPVEMVDCEMTDAKASTLPSGEENKDNGVSPADTPTNEEKEDAKDEQSLGTYDEKEKSLGISEYLSTTSFSGFTAVVKARYSDFLVHEIDLDGNVAQLTSLEVPKVESSNNVENVAEKDTDAESQTALKQSTGTDETKSLSFEELESQLAEMISDAGVAKKVMILLQAHEKASVSNSDSERNEKEKSEDTTKTEQSDDKKATDPLEKFVTLPNLEKEKRKGVHEWVRNSLKCARADTLDGKIRIWHATFEKEMPNYKAFGTHKKRKMSDRAIKKKARIDWPSDRPDFLQFVLYKENCDTTSATKEVMRRGSTVRVGVAGMKDKRGITSQFCTLYRTLPEHVMKHQNQQRGGGGGNTKQKGNSIIQIGNFQFVRRELRLGSLKGNRFDIILRNVKLLEDSENNESKRKEVLEKAAEAVKEKGFINYYGTQRFGKFTNTHLVGIAVLKGDFKKAVEILMEPNSEDRPDITQARKDWQNRFTYGETKENESSTAKRVLKRLNRFMSAEIAVVQSLAKDPLDYKKAFSRIPKNMKMMFIHAVQSLIWNQAASHRVAKMSREDVMVGDLVPNSDKESKSRVHIVTESDVESKKYTMEDVLVPVVGSKTVFPTNELGSVLKTLLLDLGLTIEMFRALKDREISANGDYRNAIVHPNDFDYSVKEYYHPLQPLLQTDLMKLNGEEIAIEPKEKEDDPTLVAMVVGFTLPSSSYATIALRELMKTPTSNEFQRTMKLQ